MLKILDERDRVLLVKRDNGMIVFARYPDMTEEDKAYMIRLFHAFELDQFSLGNENEKPISSIEDFLNFRDKDSQTDVCA